MAGAYRPPPTWLCVKTLLVISGSIILPYVADTAAVALEMSLKNPHGAGCSDTGKIVCWQV